MLDNPYKQYKEQSIMTMTKGELLVRLYEECSRRLNLSVIYIEEKKYDKANEALQRAQKIINYLRASLDYKYDISGNLDSLYDYFVRCIVKANIRKDIEIIKEVISMVDGLRDSFKEAEKIIHKKK